ncbi:hypothetical protein WICMUC_001513 [Wickerhamomyces mucosus]|uniref:Zn(2)-C6 fungal-type domain-containing protein n=1 Tax=Wickerhamomyces mucosus TaxID=1378264 RepID=A0A9P8TGZ2_9ASCO|nr:hypothetical protein WICMUC_001513 [Wickerhamomyces mucosus]
MKTNIEVNSVINNNNTNNTTNTNINNINSVNHIPSVDLEPISKQKRSAISCLRCRKRHIKCVGSTVDGSEACEKCIKANTICEFVEADKKVVVSVKYLQKLHDDITRLKKENTSLKLNLKSISISSSNTNNSKGFNKELSNSIITDEGITNKNYHIPTNSSISNGLDGLLEATDMTTILSTTFNDNTASNDPTSINSGTLTNGLTDKLPSSSSSSSSHGTTNGGVTNSTNNHNENDEVIAPLIDQDRKLVYSRTGEKFYVGSSSMTLFGIQVQNMLRQDNSNLTTTSTTSTTELNDQISNTETILEREGNAYRIMLGKTKNNPGISINFTLPSYSYSMLLVDTFIQYNDGCFYFFNEGLVKENLRRIYNGMNLNSSSSIIETIWFCKVLLIFAIGEMYLGTANNINGTNLKLDNNLNNAKLPGSGFFHQASEIFTGLFSSGAIDNLAREGGVEVLLLYAFYLQVADCTVASYFYFGLALRTSLILGMHVDADKENLSRYELEHRRRLWWTVYMYERMLSSKAGLPLSLTDNSIATELPDDFDMIDPPKGYEHYIFPEAEYITNCIKITQINAKILSCLYQQKPDNNILPVLIELVGQLIEWKQQLPEFLRPDFSQKELQISRLVTNIMSEYWTAINLSVRPLLFHFTAKQLKTNKRSNIYIDLGTYSKPIIVLFNSSFQASINLIRSLWSLMPDNMVALFGYMDREYLFTSAATLILFNVAFGVHTQTFEHLDHALLIFTKMRNLGNHPAALRRIQLLKLMSTLDFNGIMEPLIKKHEDGHSLTHIPLNQTSATSTTLTNTTLNQRKPSITNLSSSSSHQNFNVSSIPQHVESSIRSGAVTHNANKKIKLQLNQNETYYSKSLQGLPKSPVLLQTPQLQATNLDDSELPGMPDDLQLLQEDFKLDKISENELWKEITNDAVWLNSLGGDGSEFQSLMDDFDL